MTGAEGEVWSLGFTILALIALLVWLVWFDHFRRKPHE